MSSKKLPSNQERVIQNKDVQHLNKTGCDYIFLVTVKDTFYPMDHCVSVCMSVRVSEERCGGGKGEGEGLTRSCRGLIKSATALERHGGVSWCWPQSKDSYYLRDTFICFL